MSGIDCGRAEELLSDDCDGTLDDLFRPDLQAHLAGCADCRSLRAALGDVREALKRPTELAPPAGLADRISAAVVREARAPAARSHVARPALQGWPLGGRVQAVAAAVVIASTTGLYMSRGSAARQGTRLVERASNAGVYLMERKDRLVEDVRILRVVVSAAFEGRLDRVNDRVEDYRRLLERRRNAPGAKKSGARGFEGELWANPALPELVKHQCG
jgi:hypothetical protein